MNARMKSRFLALGALLLGLLFVGDAHAQGISIGPGIGYAAFRDGDGTLRELTGLAGVAQLEIPLSEDPLLNEAGEQTFDAQGNELVTWEKALLVGVPIVSGDGVNLVSFDCAYVQQIVPALWLLGGFAVAFPAANVVVPDVESTIFVGPKVGFLAEASFQGVSIPLEVTAGINWCVAGLPDEYEKPELLRFNVVVPLQLPKVGS